MFFLWETVHPGAQCQLVCGKSQYVMLTCNGRREQMQTPVISGSVFKVTRQIVSQMLPPPYSMVKDT